jgi:hypothetical protein
MSVSVKSQVVIIKAESDASAKAAVARDTLKKLLGRKSRVSVRATLLPEFASVYSVKLVAGSGKKQGEKVLDSEASAYEACRKALGRTITFICGAESSNAVEVSPKLVKKLSSEIIDAGLTKPQFDALIAQLRASVSFQ